MRLGREKRSGKRFSENLTIMIDDPESPKPKVSGNISPGGVFIYSLKTFDPGTRLAFRIFPAGPEDPDPIAVKGVVAFAVDQAADEKKGGPGVGLKNLEFGSPDDERKFTLLLASVDPSHR